MYLDLDGNVYLLVWIVCSFPLLPRLSSLQMRQVAIDKADTRCVVVAPSFFLQCKHAMIALPLLEQDVVDEPLSHGWKICTSFLIELKR